MEIEANTIQKRRNISMHKQSRTLTKPKPKIRIIHLYAPEIIKTDASNFRELVQKLTGKPEHHNHHDLHKQKGVKRSHRSHQEVHDMNKNHHGGGYSEVEDNEEDQEEEMVTMTWNNNNVEESSSGGFLNGLGEFDGFIQELGEFPFLPLNIDHPSSLASSSSSHLHGGVFAESHQFA